MSYAINTDTLKDAARYVSMNEESLFASIPPFLLEYAGERFSPDGAAGAGKTFFEKNLPIFHKCVCIDWHYCEHRTDPDLQDTVTLVAVLADAISVVCGGVPPCLVSALLVKKSLNRFCNCH
jgi:hypothetical protein